MKNLTGPLIYHNLLIYHLRINHICSQSIWDYLLNIRECSLPGVVVDTESVSMSSAYSAVLRLILSRTLLSANIVLVSCHFTTLGSGGLAYAAIHMKYLCKVFLIGVHNQYWRHARHSLIVKIRGNSK